DLRSAKKTDLSLDKVGLETALGAYFKDQPLDYKIVDRNIVISPRPEKVIQATPKVVRPTRTVQNTVGGKVLLSLGGKTIPGEGVTVTLKGTNQRVFTNKDGGFSITAKAGDVLVFSSVGYKPHDVMIVSMAVAINVT